MNRAHLLQFTGTPRSDLEARIVSLVDVLDAAEQLVAADDVARDATDKDSETADEMYEKAWDKLREVLKRA